VEILCYATTVPKRPASADRNPIQQEQSGAVEGERTRRTEPVFWSVENAVALNLDAVFVQFLC
jgi:hypothetical protein